ncbi:MAG: FAD-dependent oxidoreductase [Desulfobacterales bacterium]|nr:FAD-dependent oxidoreductase [Desulfobacterales bacterium]
MADSFAFQEYLTTRRPTSIVIIGAGYIGMEMADAMIRRGLAVSVVEFLPSVLTTFDPVLGGIVRTELEKHGVQGLQRFCRGADRIHWKPAFGTFGRRRRHYRRHGAGSGRQPAGDPTGPIRRH